VTIRFIGVLKSIAGKDKLDIESTGSVTIKECIKKIVSEMPRLERVLIDPDLQDPRPNTLILLNGKEVNVLNGLDTRAECGDEVVLISVLHTG
jgi:molybdopterin synthase sulfur carrier subunit